MKSSSLNILLVQRIESTLGIPLTAHTHPAPRGRARSIPSITPVLAASPVSPSVTTKLSSIGRTLLPLLDAFPEGAGPLVQTQPLFVSAVLRLRKQALSPHPELTPPAQDITRSSPLTHALMHVLKDQIVQSGLFYESHLFKQLKHNRATLTPLVGEPQQKESVENLDDVDIPNALRPLVRQQLDILAGQPIQWQGQVWPGALMHWELGPIPIEVHAEPEKRGQSHTHDDPETCHSTIELDLPHLGKMTARIRMTQKAVDIHLDVTRLAHELHERTDDLAQALTSITAHTATVTIASRETHNA